MAGEGKRGGRDGKAAMATGCEGGMRLRQWRDAAMTKCTFACNIFKQLIADMEGETHNLLGSRGFCVGKAKLKFSGARGAGRKSAFTLLITAINLSLFGIQHVKIYIQQPAFHNLKGSFNFIVAFHIHIEAMASGGRNFCEQSIASAACKEHR